MQKVLDLFSGIGGFTLGLEATGHFETIAFCEIEPFCQKVLHKHWPHIPIFSDITKLNGTDLPAKPDLICGGFPCQDISTAGKQAGLNGSRSGLWWEMFRLIRELRPTWCLIENVPNLRTKGADDVLASLEGEGYTCEPAVVGAWAVGAWHKRDRVWILAHTQSQRVERVRPEREQVSEALVTKKILGGSREGNASDPLCDGLHNSRSHAPESSSNKSQNGLSLGSSNWLVEPDVDRVAHGIPDRVDRIKSLGNSIVPQLATVFGEFIAQAS